MGLKLHSLFSLHVGVVLLQCIAFATTATLYAPDDPLWELDSASFNRIVFGKNNAWFIEFYSSWCGHCMRFAPIWKYFARDTENWKSAIDIGVINCVDPDNVMLCRNYGVHRYPTLKLYGAQVTELDKGERLTGGRDLDTLWKAAITLLESQELVSDNSVGLKPVMANQLSELWNELPDNSNDAYVIIENDESYTGRKIILDFSARQNIMVKRILFSNEQLTKELVGDVQSTYTRIFLKIHKNGEKEVLQRFDDGDTDTFIRDTIYEKLVGEQRVKAEKIQEDKISDDQTKVAKGVYTADLENAVRYSLRQEVGVHTDIAGAKLSALEAYLAALGTFFPGSPPVMSYLTQLHNWMLNRKGNLTGERFILAMDQLQTSSGYLPEMHEWVGCRGSTTRYRGYPCSLWTLFHTLTVQAYAKYDVKNSYDKEPQKILFVIKDYVKHFFTCEDCTEHFLSMSENLTTEIEGPKDTVLWLWQAHNQVNKRLAGDETEDPANPKIQFPPEDSCHQCHVKSTNEAGIEWDRNAVLRYLQHFYKKDRILSSQNSPGDSALGLHQTQSIGNGRSHEESATDKGVSSVVSDYTLLLVALSFIGGHHVY